MTVSPTATEAPKATVSPTATEAPKVTVSPTVTEKPTVTAKPTVTISPTATGEPEVTVSPTATGEPELTQEPSITNKPENAEAKEVAAPATVLLSKSSYVYNGKARKPKVTVKDVQGNVISSKWYTIKYQNNKKVGKATVTVNFRGSYTGSLKTKFTIIPKGTSISKLTSKSKAMTVKWKKQTKETTGYVIEYSTNSMFTKKATKSVTVSKRKTTSKTIKKLKANKKYYVRIRTYKVVKENGKSKKIYSEWSKTKTVKVNK